MDISFSTIAKYKREGDFKKLNEASLNRIYQHYKNSYKKGFAILTSWRGDRSKEENISAFDKLKRDIRSMGLGFIRLIGYWKETDLDSKKESVVKEQGAVAQSTLVRGEPTDAGTERFYFKDRKDDVHLVTKDYGTKHGLEPATKKDVSAKPEEKVTSEPSLFITGINMTQAIKLGKKYNQEAVVYAGPETDGEVGVLYMNGRVMKVGKFHPQKISQAYSKIKGKSFVFEYLEYVANSWMEKIIEEVEKRNG